ncbi:LytR/AlgR family response regulator transcription factor [Enterococcus lemanii]|uniref:LytR/AlgR family response regulator transcription factor n=1 Tax=Enterococcus lemanii TaxID=1159752 RepID=A0ABV9N0C8_9ENTE|nr:LytTR family DNA-binding domain-containing protein [Enterococcus lemanii]MBM7709651.1 DNA-binding LytR/AlgR family response regulator [Enterococcus lemanii]
MVYKIGICDDQVVEQRYLQSLVEKWAKSENHQVEIEVYASAESFLFREETLTLDLLLLDIEMGAMDGVSLAKHLRQAQQELPIIFISGYSDYLADGYDVSALHYLLKPVNPEKLFEVLNRGIKQVALEEQVLLFESSGTTHSVRIKNIRYIEVQSNYVTVHANESIRMKRPLKEIEELLDASFFRIQRSYIVQLNWIKKITRKEVILNDETKLPLARGKYEALNQQMIRYL